MKTFLLLFISILLLMFSITAFPADCKKDWKTEIQIFDCNGKPFPNVLVTITLCCGEGGELSGTTDENGKVTFNCHKEDICPNGITIDLNVVKEKGCHEKTDEIKKVTYLTCTIC